ncbi:MAG: DUF4091 domain-containing protein [Acidobacteriota bacterium]|nr:DUF4091 domain-containing protein [Acidobacteriota bacterium]
MSLRITLHVVALGFLQLVTLPSETRPSSLTWWTAGPLVKIHPADLSPERPGRRAEIFAARNEFEAFQLVLRSDGEDVSGLDVDLSDLRSSAGAVISKNNATLYLENFINVVQPSMLDGQRGLWPDPLIPRIDRYSHERRNAFPFGIRKGDDQPVWIEVFVPQDAQPGVYTASLSVLREGTVKFSIPVSLTVWAFALPSTSSLRSSFGFNGVTALKQHRGSYTSDADLYALTRIYQLAALEHRVSIHGGSLAPPKFQGDDDNIRIDWHAYDEEVGPFLNGTAIPKAEPLYGARATSTDLRAFSEFPTPQQQSLYFAQWTKHFEKNGWRDRLFYYLWDEPGPEAYPKVAARGQTVLRADPAIRNLLTIPFSGKLANVVSIWVPLVNCLEPRPGSEDFCHESPALADYAAQRAQGKSVWFYQSCASHGCGGKGGPYFAGWPSYMIDAPGTSNRVMQWIAWKYKLDGELYYSMNEAYAHPGDPWTDLLLSGGNGDGTLFYPGRPSGIGGHTHIPIESIRLKLIREGMEDYEYLALIAEARGAAAADAFADRIVRKPWSSEFRPDAFAQVRQEMGEILNGIAAERGAANQ